MSSTLSIYIHWPFCEAKCPYCDFNSHVRTSVNQDDWTEAYIKSLDFWAEKTNGKNISSIFFGGGTPSLMSEKSVSRIIETISKLWTCQRNMEVSLEANPSSVEAKKFKAFRQAGVNRISIGVQALNDNDLKRLGRLHTANEAKEAFEIAKDAFDRVSFDLIYARQYQTLQDWEHELLMALNMSVGHLSLYQLTIEDNTRFGELSLRGKLHGLPQDSISIDFYQLTQQICKSQNLNAYEISNHARQGEECQHNLNYWRGGQFIGVGPGAHGRVDYNGQRHLTETSFNPEVWLKQVQTNNIDQFTSERLSSTEQAEEYIMMGLRLEEGLDLDHYHQLSKQKLPKQKLDKLIFENLIHIRSNILKTTKYGKVLTNYVIRELLC